MITEVFVVMWHNPAGVKGSFVLRGFFLSAPEAGEFIDGECENLTDAAGHHRDWRDYTVHRFIEEKERA